MDAQLVQRTLAHIQEHIDILSDPNVANILTLLGETPLGPIGGGIPSPQAAAPQQPNQQGQEQIPPLLENPEAQSVAVQQNMGPLPSPAQPAGVAQGILPAQPTTPEQLAINNLGV
jgi:hypothetical protein